MTLRGMIEAVCLFVSSAAATFLVFLVVWTVVHLFLGIVV